jgi:hypothetical protein
MKFFSPSGQDRFVFENFHRGKRDGVFVDVGTPRDGNFANSLFFERMLGWRGLCIELLPADPRRGARARVAPSGSLERVEPAKSVATLIEEHSLGRVDYCAIESAGAVAVLSEFDPQRFDVSVFAITGAEDVAPVAELLARRGYEVAANLPQAHIFKCRGLRRLARTSVICAVWHGDPDRERLLAGHAANLSRQSVPIELIYAFDGADAPPESIPGRKIVVHESLSIYQAWNVALALVATPFVINLNLDDRLAPDAIERLENVLAKEGAALAAGDWKVCYSQPATDAVESCYPADRLPFLPAWPPAPGSITRLGSGTGERATFGPATLWRMDAHLGAPRYPWRLPDGTLLKVIGDAGWWMLLAGHLKKKLVRLPEIVGNYHSHPDSQAEFRAPQAESALLNQLGISLL